MKRSFFSLPALIFSFFLLSGYAGRSQSTFDLAAARKQVEKSNSHFMESFKKGDAAATAESYASDAKVMGANAPAIVGRQDIEKSFSGLMTAGIGQIDLSTENVWGNADLLAEEGVYTIISKDGKTLDKGKYIVLFRKVDGNWKIFRDCYNSDLPLPGSK